MIRISKEQAIALDKQGYKIGDKIFHTWGHNKSYYMIETPKMFKALEELEKKTKNTN